MAEETASWVLRRRYFDKCSEGRSWRQTVALGWVRSLRQQLVRVRSGLIRSAGEVAFRFVLAHVELKLSLTIECICMRHVLELV